jgi:hypothetical protein
MRWRLLGCVLLGIGMIAACQPTTITEYVIEITRIVEVTQVVTVVATSENPSSGPLPLSTTTPAAPATATPNATATITPTGTPDIFPTPVVGQIFVAEQLFERGRMYWLQPIQKIWVATTDSSDQQVWFVYEDTFVDGETEIDPKLTPPAGFIQPVRGFGKLWRENTDVQETLGWAEAAENGYMTRYEYRAGGTVKNNEYIYGAGKHLITLQDGQIIEFNENGTWQILPNTGN